MDKALSFIYSLLFYAYLALMFIMVPLLAIPSGFILGFRASFRSIIKLFTRFGLFALGIRVRISGIENLPKKGNIVLLSGHVSFLDPFIVNAVLPGYTNFIVPTDIPFGPVGLFSFRAAGHVIKVRGTPMEGAARISAVVKRINEGDRFILFPSEGTNPEGSIPYIREGFYKILEGAEAEFVPVRITGSIGRKFSLMPANVGIVIGKPVSKDEVLKGRKEYLNKLITSL